MILYDPSLVTNCRDYGIMLPISPSRGEKILEFLDVVPERPEKADSLVTREDIERVHDRNFAAALYGDAPEGARALEKALLQAYELIDAEGKPHRYEPEKAVKPLGGLFDAIRAQSAGTYLACRMALEKSFCYYLGGGMHHARYDYGTGFCLINDIMIAAGKIQAEGRAGLLWIVDVDAHKGCGTAELIRLARERGDLGGGSSREMLSLSIHMAGGWPLDAETLAGAAPGRAPLVPSDVEIPLEAGGEGRYSAELERGLRGLEELSAARGRGIPDLVIVVDGADPYEHDGLPSSALLRLTLEQCVERDMLIFRYLSERNIASAWIMAGGYGERAWEPTAHFLRAATGTNASRRYQ
ncbi:MAG: histone deacetylase [Treponema sp.]|jgi:acetoin utilization deacetylase AcuC-like enzyme|nr:histone deacetylase [Treponema sp.]